MINLSKLTSICGGGGSGSSSISIRHILNNNSNNNKGKLAAVMIQQQQRLQQQLMSVQHRNFITETSSSSSTILVPYTITTMMGYDNNNNNNIQQQQQQILQVRNHWTKAKKKRYARYKKREELAANGLEIRKPPMYIPRDIKIVNAFTKEERAQESKDHDESASEGLREKLLNLKEKQDTLLLHHMSVVSTGSGKHVVMSDRVRKLFSLHNGNQQEVIAAQKKLGMELFQIREGDTGSTAVQIIALTTRIQQLQTHMNKHKKDMHSKRGMDALFVRRRKLLDYMERKQFDIYRKVVKTLGLVR
jgi:small subunit ribosomal protein S15